MLDVDEHLERFEGRLSVLERSEENFWWDVSEVEFEPLSADVDKSSECFVESKEFVEFLWGIVEDDPDGVPRQIAQGQFVLIFHFDVFFKTSLLSLWQSFTIACHFCLFRLSIASHLADHSLFASNLLCLGNAWLLLGRCLCWLIEVVV